jgi:DNA-binding CsgD family transcriptional regulator
METQFDMNHGFGLVQKSKNPAFKYEFFGFTAPAKNNAVVNVFVNEMKLFQKFSHYFRGEAASVLKKLHENPVNIGSIVGERYFVVQPTLLHLSPEEADRFHSDFDCVVFSQEKNAYVIPKLSRREQQCLNLYLQGRTAIETGLLLGLSHRTVESYLENLKIKLNCDRKIDILKMINSKHI